MSGKSDPFAVVTMRGDNANNKPVVVGQTDVYVICVITAVIITIDVAKWVAEALRDRYDKILRRIPF